MQVLLLDCKIGQVGWSIYCYNFNALAWSPPVHTIPTILLPIFTYSIGSTTIFQTVPSPNHKTTSSWWQIEKSTKIDSQPRSNFNLHTIFEYLVWMLLIDLNCSKQIELEVNFLFPAGTMLCTHTKVMNANFANS